MLQAMIHIYTSRIRHGIGQDTNLHNKNQASDAILYIAHNKIQGMYLPFNPKKFLWWDLYSKSSIVQSSCSCLRTCWQKYVHAHCWCPWIMPSSWRYLNFNWSPCFCFMWVFWRGWVCFLPASVSMWSSCILPRWRAYIYWDSGVWPSQVMERSMHVVEEQQSIL